MKRGIFLTNYKMRFDCTLPSQIVPKVEDMLQNKWQVKNLRIQSLSKSQCYVSFESDDNRKCYAFHDVIQKYGGTVNSYMIIK